MNVVPIDVPPRAELWRRQRLALSILGHREPTRDNWEVLKQALQGLDLTQQEPKEVS